MEVILHNSVLINRSMNVIKPICKLDISKNILLVLLCIAPVLIKVV